MTATTGALDDPRFIALDERRRHWVEAAAELSDALSPPIGESAALSVVAGRARTAADAYATAILQLPVGQHPVISAQDGPPGVDVAGFVRQVVAEARMAEEQATTLEVDLGDRHAVVLPLRAHLADPSVLLVVRDRPRDPGSVDRELLATFADQAGLALDRALAVSGRAELAVLAERSRIAQDLSDVVIQRLFAIGLRLESIRARTDDASSEALIAGVISDLDLTIRDVRGTVLDLRPAAQT